MLYVGIVGTLYISMAEEAVKPQSVVGPVGILQLKGGAGKTLNPTTKQAAWAPQSFNLACTTKTPCTQETHLLMMLALRFAIHSMVNDVFLRVIFGNRCVRCFELKVN